MNAETEITTSANTFAGDQRMKYGEYLSAPHWRGDPYCAHRYDGCLCGPAVVTELMQELELLASVLPAHLVTPEMKGIHWFLDRRGVSPSASETK